MKLKERGGYMKHKEQTISEVTSKGGNAVVKKYGSKHMSEIAKRSKTGKKTDPEYYKNLSRQGIEARKAKKRSSLDKVSDLLTGK